MVEVSLVLLGGLVVFAIWAYVEFTRHKVIVSAHEELIAHLDSEYEGIKLVELTLSSKLKELEDRVGKIQTVGFLTKRVQDGTSS